MNQRVWFPIHRVGPYHHARFQEASNRLQLTVIETRPASQEYLWSGQLQGNYQVVRLPVAQDPESDLPAGAIDGQLHRLLQTSGKPDALVCMGWADRFSRRLIHFAHVIRVPLVLVSDSRWQDHPRRWPQELSKRILLRQASAALVAGIESRAYLELLGFPPGAIFQPWDVVDNAYFARALSASGKARHFLCVSRLVDKKNHLGLLAAYAHYQANGGQWGLRLVGSGPMEAQIREAIQSLPNSRQVELLPFQQLEALAMMYRQASAFVLASHTDQWGLVVNEAIAAGCPVLVSRGCGCAVDLVAHGRTGLVFEPGHPESLAHQMLELERTPLQQRVQLAEAARSKLNAFSLQAFVEGLTNALFFAIQQPRSSVRAAWLASVLP